MDDKKQIAAAIRDYLARERMSREQFAFKTKLGKSTVDKLLTGLFSEKTLAIVEKHTKLALRCPATAAPETSGENTLPEPAATSSLDRPSIAVLPFADLSPQRGQQYFADGIVEDLITALSRVPRVVVIARNASFLYRNRTADVRQIGRELGVRYLLEGSVRRAGSRLRIAGQLIDAVTGAHLWGDHYDGDLADLFELQDRVTARVVAAIAPHVLAAELERIRKKRPDNLDSHDLYLRALASLREMTRSGTKQAIALGERALRLDPHYAVAAALVAFAYARRMAHQWWDDLATEERRGIALARTALEHGPDDPEVLAMAGYALACLDDAFEQGLVLLDRSIALNPNNALALSQAGWVRCYLGQAADAIGDFDRALRLSPGETTRFRMRTGLAYAHLFLEEFEEAVTWARRALLGNPNFAPGYRPLVCALAHLGRLEEAREAADRLLALVPDFTPAIDQRLFRRSGKLPLILSGFERAGLPAAGAEPRQCRSSVEEA
jgi:adenylate cyclase